MSLRATGGILVVINFILFAYNAFATALQRRPIERPASVPISGALAPAGN
jgi:hypothetical protein